MNIFDSLEKLVKKSPPPQKELYVSLVLDESYVAGSAWSLGEKKKPEVIASSVERSAAPSWDERIRISDKVLAKLEYETGSAVMKKVIFGLGDSFLTSDGNIEKDVRPHLKKLSTLLELTPLGFVPITTSIAHFLRETEGIPASIILLSITEKFFNISIYRVGRLTFQKKIEKTEAFADDIEKALKSGTGDEVLPSRILLFGPDDIVISEVRSTLLKHQWTSRSNFLHYPKIDIMSLSDIAKTVSHSGASELTQSTFEEEKQAGGMHVPYEKKELVSEKEEGKDTTSEEKSTEQKETPTDSTEVNEQRGTVHTVVVQPETLGFHETHDKNDDMTLKEVIASSHTGSEEKEEVVHREEKVEQEEEREEILPRHQGVSRSTFLDTFHIRGFLYYAKKAYTRMPKKLLGIVAAILLILGGGFFYVSGALPKCDVTLLTIPQEITYEGSITIDPSASTFDSEEQILPGKKIEKLVSGEKSTPATGKKKVGDPGKGTVIIYNKSESQVQNLKKGTALTTGTLQFTLDSDVSVASATTNLAQGETTFGKATTTITASVVGAEGNVAAGKEFTFKDISTSTLVARNEQAFTGGTSREVIVVSRADTDTLLKSLTGSLVEKAKAELAQSVSGKDQIIDDTVKTVVKEKQFVEEIDQEAKDLHMTLSITLTAISYSEDDVASLLSSLAIKDIPEGYKVSPESSTVTLTNVKVNKDGTITAKAKLVSSAVPEIQKDAVVRNIAGKSIQEAQDIIKNLPGIAAVEFRFKQSLRKDRLPTKTEAITISITVSE